MSNVTNQINQNAEGTSSPNFCLFRCFQLHHTAFITRWMVLKRIEHYQVKVHLLAVSGAFHVSQCHCEAQLKSTE